MIHYETLSENVFKRLLLRNFVLVESAAVDFPPGFIAVTGETGAGKSVMLQSLQLLLGAKSEARFIREGCDKALIEGVFDAPPQLPAFLGERGFELLPEDDLVLRREISLQGKSQIWINHQPATQSLLKQIAPFLGHLVDQQTHQELSSPETQLDWLDQWGDLLSLREEYQTAFRSVKQCEKNLALLLADEARREAALESCLKEREEILSAIPSEGEEEELEAEYRLLSRADEREKHLSAISHLLEEKGSILFQARQIQRIWPLLCEIDPSFQPFQERFLSMILELEDLSSSLRSEQGKLECDAHELQRISERIASLHRLKRRYGATREAIHEYLEKLEKEREYWEQWEESVEQTRRELAAAAESCDQRAKILTGKRQEAAADLAPRVEAILRELNMPHAQFHIIRQSQGRSLDGDERVEFLLAPNLGTKALPLRSGASGGEMSRLWFALHRLLGEKNRVPLLIFDEVDANIGGQTARKIARIAKSLALSQQIIWITHFPQVAEEADAQIVVEKEEKEGATRTRIQLLPSEGRNLELARMAGWNE